MNFDLSGLGTTRDTEIDIFYNMGWSREQTVEHWSRAFNRIETGQVDAWDWQWFRHLSNQNQLTITPAVNLVANIGFGRDATHTFGPGKPIFQKIGVLDFPLRHPRTFAPNSRFELGFEANKYFFAAKSTAGEESTAQKSRRQPALAKLVDALPRPVVEKTRAILFRFRLLSVVEKLLLGKQRKSWQKRYRPE